MPPQLKLDFSRYSWDSHTSDNEELVSLLHAALLCLYEEPPLFSKLHDCAEYRTVDSSKVIILWGRLDQNTITPSSDTSNGHDNEKTRESSKRSRNGLLKHAEDPTILDHSDTLDTIQSFDQLVQMIVEEASKLEPDSAHKKRNSNHDFEQLVSYYSFRISTIIMLYHYIILLFIAQGCQESYV